jgi:hypothetical protein
MLKAEGEAFAEHARDRPPRRTDPPQAGAHRRHAVRHPAAGGHHDRPVPDGSVLSRVDGLVRRPGKKVRRRSWRSSRLRRQVQRRVRSNYGKIDDNDDELIKPRRPRFRRRRFSWDNLPS